MKCKLCDTYFANEVSFLNLFNSPDLCNDCLVKYQPHLFYEVIPFNNGIIEYYYLYDEIILNQKQKNYLNKHMKTLFEQTLSTRNSVIIWIDFENIRVIKKYLKFILGFRKLTFMSLLRMNFDDCVDFY